MLPLAAASWTGSFIAWVLMTCPWRNLPAVSGTGRSRNFWKPLAMEILTAGHLANAINELVPRQSPLETPRPRLAKKEHSTTDGGFRILGVGNLLTTTARCCRPVPNDPIIGYITRGRGVTIHRQDCGNVLRLQGEDRDRLIEVEWGSVSDEGYLVDIAVEAYDRSGLLRDITVVLANEKINLNGVNTATDKRDGIARMSLTLGDC